MLQRSNSLVRVTDLFMGRCFSFKNFSSRINIQLTFLIELIFNCPIMGLFGFSGLRFRKVSVALLLLLFSRTLLLFVS